MNKNIVCNILAFCLAIIFFLQAFTASERQSLIVDEPIFIASGYYHYVYDDLKIHKESPPLVSKVLAWPLLFLDLKFPESDNYNIQRSRQDGVALDFLALNFDRLSQIIFFSRLPVSLAGILLLLVVYYIGKKMFGATAALFSCTMLAVSPNLIAHAQFATSDLLCSLTFLISLYCFWESIQNNKTKWWLLTGIATGISIMIKFSNLVLCIIYLVIALFLLFSKQTTGKIIFRGAALVFIITYFIIACNYNLDWTLSKFLIGLSRVYSNHVSGYFFYLNGEFYQGGRWDYFLQLILYKSPIILIGSFLFWPFIIFNHPNRKTFFLFIFIPTILILIITSQDEANIGLRRILMIYPLFYLSLAALYSYVESKKIKILFIILGLISAIDCLRIYPNHLTYFNFMAGGPRAGPSLANDSNIDWGQGLIQLAEWQKMDSEREALYFSPPYFLNPQIYGINFKLATNTELSTPLNGFYAISVQNLISLQQEKDPNKFPGKFFQIKPWAVVANVIYIYKFKDGQSVSG